MRISLPLLLAAAIPATARATWSIILIDTRTGEIAVGSATCLTGFDLRAATPILIPGVGAATAQSFVDNTGQNRVFIRDRLAFASPPATILSQLATFDTGHQTRQYGIGDVFGRVATFSGTGAGPWAGGQTGSFGYTLNGQVGTIAYAIQGNVLTGSPVVEQAVFAAINTPGDLAAKLMASMHAARLMGGDGRCSCSQSNPTGCGAPPPTFNKSSHIAYMLIARAGDTEGCNGIYRAASSSLAIVASDLTTDLRPELIVANLSSNNLSVIFNLSDVAPAPLRPVFNSLPTNYGTPAGPRGLARADFNGDSIGDLAVVASGANSVGIFHGSLTGLQTSGGTVATGLSPRQVVAADFDGANGPDLATANFSANSVSILLNTGAGGFSPAASATVDAGPVDVAAANILGSPAVDLAVLSRTANTLTILRGNGNGTFTPDPAIPVNAGPVAIIAADLDGDTDTDIAVCSDSPRSVQVFRNDAGVLAAQSYAIAYIPADLTAGDINGDTLPDLIVGGAASFTTLLNNAAGGFAIDRTYTVAGSITGAALADLDGDGDLDVAFSSTGGGAVTVKNLGPGPLLGTFNDGLGCATGDYFMNHNIAFTAAGDPDPVLTLQTRYDQWRAALINHPDAVQSVAAITPMFIPSTGAATATLTLSLRDWRGKPVLIPPTSITVTEIQPALTSIGPLQSLGGGNFQATVTGGPVSGLTRFRVRIDDGGRPVTLMPEVPLSIYQGSCYPNCDGSTMPPVLTGSDFMCFLNRFAAADPYANCDGFPAFSANDFICYLNRFVAGCT